MINCRYDSKPRIKLVGTHAANFHIRYRHGKKKIALRKRAIRINIEKKPRLKGFFKFLVVLRTY